MKCKFCNQDFHPSELAAVSFLGPCCQDCLEGIFNEVKEAIHEIQINRLTIRIENLEAKAKQEKACQELMEYLKGKEE